MGYCNVRNPLVKVISREEDQYSQGDSVFNLRPVRLVHLGAYYMLSCEDHPAQRVRVIAMGTDKLCTVAGANGRVLGQFSVNELRQMKRFVRPTKPTTEVLSTRCRGIVKRYAPGKAPKAPGAKPKSRVPHRS